MKTYLQISNLRSLQSLRSDFIDQISLQTFDENLKADLQFEFENWLNAWTADAYRLGITSATVPNNPQIVS